MPDAETPAPQVPPAGTPAPAGPVSEVPTDERILAAAAYIPMLFIGALIMKPKSKFCQMHGKQGLFLTILTFFVLLMLVAIPFIGSILFLAMVAVIGIGAYQGFSGNEFKIPGLYQVAMLMPVDTLFSGTTVKPVSTKSEKTPTEPAAPAAPTPPPPTSSPNTKSKS